MQIRSFSDLVLKSSDLSLYDFFIQSITFLSRSSLKVCSYSSSGYNNSKLFKNTSSGPDFAGFIISFVSDL